MSGFYLFLFSFFESRKRMGENEEGDERGRDEKKK